MILARKFPKVLTDDALAFGTICQRTLRIRLILSLMYRTSKRPKSMILLEITDAYAEICFRPYLTLRVLSLVVAFIFYSNASIVSNGLRVAGARLPTTTHLYLPFQYSLPYKWTASSEFGTYRLCEPRRFRRACASAQSQQNLRCSLI